MNVTGSLSKVILSQKIVGEKPSTMTTKSMTLSVNRQQPHLMPKDIPIQGGKFGLPNDLPFLERKVFDDSPEGGNQTVSFVDSSVRLSSCCIIQSLQKLRETNEGPLTVKITKN